MQSLPASAFTGAATTGTEAEEDWSSSAFDLRSAATRDSPAISRLPGHKGDENKMGQPRQTLAPVYRVADPPGAADSGVHRE